MRCLHACFSGDKTSRKGDLFCSLYIHATQGFRSSVLCWSESDFCFSRKVIWGVGDGRMILFVALTECVWWQAGLAEGTACSRLVGSTMAWPFSQVLGFLGGCWNRTAGAGGAEQTLSHGCLSPPMLCFPHSSAGNALALHFLIALFLCWELLRKN